MKYKSQQNTSNFGRRFPSSPPHLTLTSVCVPFPFPIKQTFIQWQHNFSLMAQNAKAMKCLSSTPPPLQFMGISIKTKRFYESWSYLEMATSFVSVFCPPLALPAHSLVINNKCLFSLPKKYLCQPTT